MIPARLLTLAAAALVLALPAPTIAQQAEAQQTAAAGPTFSQQELEQLLAPIALYPDVLLAQILMASTYPLEIVSAERWVKVNAGLKDKALEDALQQQPWDPSVKSLVVVPEVLTMMNEQIEWTQKLGDAFLAQQKEVMATAQSLRAKAMAQGSLQDTKEQKIVTETVESTTVIKVQPTNPEVVYVPTYNPTVVYGAWPSPAYPPYAYYPPGYAAGSMLFSFTAGAIVGGALWGDCNWGRGDVDINVNKYNNFNRANISNRNWSHNATHRGAVPYRDRGVAQQYGRTRSADAASREQFRGRAEGAGTQRATTQRGSTTAQRGSQAAQRGSATPQRAQAAGDAGTRSRPDAGTRPASADAGGMRNVSAFDTGSRQQANDFSNRGSSSLNSARASGNYGGGARASGGGGFGGGGAGGRGGGGRR